MLAVAAQDVELADAHFAGAHRQVAVWGNRVRPAAPGARPRGSVDTTALPKTYLDVIRPRLIIVHYCGCARPLCRYRSEAVVWMSPPTELKSPPVRVFWAGGPDGHQQRQVHLSVQDQVRYGTRPSPRQPTEPHPFQGSRAVSRCHRQCREGSRSRKG